MLQQIRRVGQHAAMYAMFRQELLDEMLVARLGEYRWDADHQARQLVFSSERGEVTASSHLLASIAAVPASLLWGYAEPFAPYVGPDPLAAQIRELGRQHGLDELTREEVEYDFSSSEDQAEVIAAMAHDVGMLGVELFGPKKAYYTFPTGGGARQVLLLEDLSEPIPEITIDGLFPRLGRYLSGVDDIAWSLEGLVRLLPGWRFEQVASSSSTQRLRVIDTQGASFSVSITRDTRGRVSNIGLQGVDRPGPPAR